MNTRILIAGLAVLASACTITSEKTEGEIRCPDGRVVPFCHERTEFSTQRGDFSGEFEIFGGSVSISADTGEEVECKPKNNSALQDLMDALKDCECDDGNGGGGGDDSDNSEQGKQEEKGAAVFDGECTTTSTTTTCKYEMKDSEWDCERTN